MHQRKTYKLKIVAGPILIIAMLSAFFLTSCKEKPIQEKIKTSKSESVRTISDEIVTSSATDINGKKLEMSFNNTKNTATLKLDGEIIELVGQKPASGIWYKNDSFELRGKGKNVVLTKEGKVVFKN